MKRWGLFLVFAMVAGLTVTHADLKAAAKKKKDPDKTSSSLTVKGELTDKDDKDRVRIASYRKVYTFKMTKGRTYQIDMMSKDLDAYLRLEDPAGKQVASDDDGGDGFNARIVYKADETGDFKIIATTFQGGATGKFTLLARDKDAPEGGKSIELANDKGMATFTGALAADDTLYKGKRSKVFTFRMEKGKTYQIDHMSQAFDAYLYLEGPDGKLLAEDDDGGEGLNSRIVVRAENAGVYRFIATSLAGNRTGNFSLTVREKQ